MKASDRAYKAFNQASGIWNLQLGELEGRRKLFSTLRIQIFYVYMDPFLSNSQAATGKDSHYISTSVPWSAATEY